MSFLVKETISLVCDSRFKWLAVPFTPIFDLVFPPMLLFFVILLFTIRYSNSGFLRTDSTNTITWERSLLSTFVIYYCVSVIFSIISILAVCKAQNIIPGPKMNVKYGANELLRDAVNTVVPAANKGAMSAVKPAVSAAVSNSLKVH